MYRYSRYDCSNVYLYQPGSFTKEAARGEGETIKGLATILSCKDTALFAENMQKNYGEIFSKETNSSIEIVKAIGETVKGNANLHNTCGAI